MDALRPLELSTWSRREYFEHYRHRVPCTYALTVDLDVTSMVTALRATRRKTYIAQVWALAWVVNQHDEFRMGLTEQGAPGVWDTVHPAFTVFNPDRESFASVWTPFDADFAAFHERAAQVLATYRTATSLFPQEDVPPNVFDISSLPWISFTGFSLHIKNVWDHFLPIFTLGKYTTHGDRTLLPLSVQVNHAAADGFHTARLVQELQTLLSRPSWIT
ncbi:type A chloramphenicol O-acetyltransferase [Raineyella sp. LH-20]|uniref:type A chloramphenicol O-acetyltransferase n=1 Tax=Raineyella sp. LH-20 TaxID=3081204 RepID=UPI002953FACC|nr:type A chloramphenicol O-acetyltransferase [Raineyella sp. LH-20]WOP17559.1 type A chloramphenicol O-acetyltransferase [Raineyella sp. LH-20]